MSFKPLAGAELLCRRGRPRPAPGLCRGLGRRVRLHVIGETIGAEVGAEWKFRHVLLWDGCVVHFDRSDRHHEPVLGELWKVAVASSDGSSNLLEPCLLLAKPVFYRAQG